jgi:hypothetical protein
LERHHYLISSTEWGTGTVKKIICDWKLRPKKVSNYIRAKKCTIPNLNSKSSKKANKTHPYETERQSIRIFIHYCVFCLNFPQNFYFIISFCDTIFQLIIHFTVLFSYLFRHHFLFQFFIICFSRELCDKKNYFTCFALDFLFSMIQKIQQFSCFDFERLKIETSKVPTKFTKNRRKNQKSPLKVPANFTQNSNLKNTFYRFKIN